VTSTETGKQVVVRINDRGPFHASRIIDLSFTAALKLGLLGKGSHEVVVERLFPGPPQAEESLGEARRNAPAVPLAAATTADGASDVELRPVMLPGAANVKELAPAMADVASAGSAESATPPQPMPGGFYVQLGAFSRAESAEAFRKQLAAFANVLGQLEIAVGGTLYRVYSGPFASRAAAQQAIAALPSTLQLRPIVVRR
jgi:rare lipoprotein A